MSLVDNGTDSLEKGLEAFNRYSSKKDVIHLKDAIMAIHHGLELLLKELLRRESRYLIFEDLRQIAKKQKQADDQKVDIFFLTQPPRTVSFQEALERVETLIRPKYLDNSLVGALSELNAIRNRIEHYSIDVDVEDVVSLISSIQQPLLTFLRKNLGDIAAIRRISNAQAWIIARKEFSASEVFQDRVARIMESFHSQTIPGKLFNAFNEVILPDTQRIQREYRHERFPQYSVDLYAETARQPWIAEVKSSLPKDVRSVSRIRELAFLASLIEAQSWLISIEKIPSEMIDEAHASRIYLSGPKELESLERMLNI
jgi:hypothetical protein